AGVGPTGVTGAPPPGHQQTVCRRTQRRAGPTEESTWGPLLTRKDIGKFALDSVARRALRTFRFNRGQERSTSPDPAGPTYIRPSCVANQARDLGSLMRQVLK